MNTPGKGLLSPLVLWVLTGVAIVGLGAGMGWLVGARLPTQAQQADTPPASTVGAALKPDPSTQPTGVAILPLTSAQSEALRWPLWEFELQAGVPARSESLTPPPWRFIGAVMVDGQWRLIVLRQGASEPEYYKKGERLPGGYTIRDIGQEDVTLMSGRREIVFSYIGSP